MRKVKGIAAAFIAILMCCIHVYAIQMQSSNENIPDDVIGQVTITNVDSADNSIRLNGAYIKIINKETNEEYTEVISDDGMLVYELPLGSYLLTQELAPSDYELNNRVYEFTLQIPPGANASNIKVVNASVTLTNEHVGSQDAEILTADEQPEAVTHTPVPTVTATPVPTQPNASEQEKNPVSPSEKNPATTDTSHMVLAVIVILVILLSGCIISMKRLNSKL